MNKKQGTYFLLRRGSKREREHMILGYIPEDAVERALERMQEEELDGTASRVRALYERNREHAIEYLTDDTGEIDLGMRDWSRTSLRQYVLQSGYMDWRAKKVRSWANEKGHLRRVLEGLGKVRMKDVDGHVVADFLDSLTVTKGGVEQPASGNYKRIKRACLQAVLKRAFRLRHIEEMPDLAVFEIEGATIPITDPVDPLDLSELAALMEASPPKYRAMWAVQAGQGLRPSELVRLRWEHIDLEMGTMAVPGTKTVASAAVVPLTPLARGELRRWRDAAESTAADAIVFPSKDGKEYADTAAGGYRKALTNQARRAGIDRRITPYSLRASFATIAWALGIDKGTAVRIGRWTDATMFDRVYCRPRPEDLAAQLREFTIESGAHDAERPEN